MEKKIEEWYEQLPEPIRSQALENRRLFPLTYETAISPSDALFYGFHWIETPQGYEHWDNIYKRALNGEFDKPEEPDYKDQIEQLKARIKELEDKYEPKPVVFEVGKKYISKDEKYVVLYSGNGWEETRFSGTVIETKNRIFHVGFYSKGWDKNSFLHYTEPVTI